MKISTGTEHKPIIETPAQATSVIIEKDNMIIECPECGTKYSVDKPLQPGDTYFCEKCKAAFTPKIPNRFIEWTGIIFGSFLFGGVVGGFIIAVADIPPWTLPFFMGLAFIILVIRKF